MPIITLLTDYGSRDAYVGAVKGVILGIAPEATIIDITHEIDPFNVAHASFVMRQAWSWFPAGTVHVAIVDPGVGTDRRVIIGKYEGQCIVAPDNGLVTWLHRDFVCEGLHVAEDRRYFLPKVSTTFHGRDIMAPVGAHLANGIKLRNFGRVVDRLEILPIPHRADREGACWRGAVVYIDRFGTLVTNLHEDQWPGPQAERWSVVSVAGAPIGPVHSTFAEVPIGSPVAYFGGAGLLEIAINLGRAVDQFGSSPSVEVLVQPDTPKSGAETCLTPKR